MDVCEKECMTICPQCLADVVIQIVEGLLWKRLQAKTKMCEKLDLKIIEQGSFFKIEITKCGNQFPDLKYLLTISIKAELISKTSDQNVVARIEQKLKTGYQVKKVMYSTKTFSFSLVSCDEDEPLNEFSVFKRFVTIKFAFQVQNKHFEEFFSLMVKSTSRIEKIDPNIKFTIRKGDNCLYKNHVHMDDSVVCCKILTAACTSIFKNSHDPGFRENIKKQLNIEEPKDFEETFERLLVAQVDKNFIGSSK